VIEATRKKLREAQFFYLQLAEVESRIFRNWPESPDYYLSALLSAARSVADVIEAEEGDRYRQWFANRKLAFSDAENDLLKFSREQRVQTVHVRGANVHTATRNVPLHELQRELSDRGGVIEVHAGGVPGAPFPLPEAERRNLAFTQRPDESVLELLRRYLDLLTRLVDEYEQHVSPPNNVLERERGQ